MATAASSGAASIANIGSSGNVQERATRYSAVRKMQEGRMGASALLSSASVTELQKRIAQPGTSAGQSGAANLGSAHQELAAIEADLAYKESQILIERQRQAALIRRAELDKELKALQGQTVEISRDLGVPAPTTQLAGAGVAARVPASLPRSMKYNKMALRFKVWFKEPWYDEFGEGFDVRAFILIYRLEDMSVEIIEPPQLNSGKPAGAFLKRTVLLKQDGSNFAPSDFAVGNTFKLSGRTFTVSDADDATRRYFAENIPDVLLVQALAMPRPPPRRAFEPGMGSSARAAAPSKGRSGTAHLRASQGSFLDDDGKVLSFTGIWDDSARPLGEIRRLRVKFYLVDSTMDVGELTGANSGRDLTSRFRVTRQRLVKLGEHGKGVSIGVNFGQPRHERQYFTPQDLIVGNSITIFGRNVQLVQCDSFTRGYYRSKLGIEQPAPNQGSRATNAPRSTPRSHVAHDPTDKLNQLEDAIRKKLEVASNFGTNQDQERRLLAMFSRFDLDGSGRISLAEFRESMQAFSMFGADVDALFNKFDRDGNGNIDVSEFCALLYGTPAANRGSLEEPPPRRTRTPRSARGMSDTDVQTHMHAAVSAASQGPNAQMLLILEQSLREKAESLSNFSTSAQIQQRKLADMLKRYDSRGLGGITKSEFRAALANMHFAVQDADLLFSSYGADQVGELRYDGFCKLLLQRKPMRGTIKFSGSNAW